MVSPDIGGISRARNFCSLFGKNLVVINKTRDANNECFMSEIIGNVKNKKCIIIDDIVDSGNTLWIGEKARLYILGIDEANQLLTLQKDSNGLWVSPNDVLKNNIKANAKLKYDIIVIDEVCMD